MTITIKDLTNEEYCRLNSKYAEAKLELSWSEMVDVRAHRDNVMQGEMTLRQFMIWANRMIRHSKARSVA